MYFYLPNVINIMYSEKLREMVSPPGQNTLGACNQITLLVLYCTISRLIALLKVTDTPTQVSDILCLTLTFKFNNFTFQILPLFFHDMFTSFTSYTDQMTYITLPEIL